jgi:hypothetical protein
MPGYEYGADDGQIGIFRWGTTGAGDDRKHELKLVLPWYPKVTRYIVSKDSHGKILDARYTLDIGGHEDTIDADELGAAEAWKRWPHAVGVQNRVMRDCLGIIVQVEAAKRDQTVATPYWDGDRLVLPGADLLVRGYGESYDSGEFEELLSLAIANPRLALMMGFSYGAPYVEPLQRQPFWVHSNGRARQGKTTGLFAACCIWGRPGVKGINRSWNTTTIGLTTVLGQLGVLPVFLDELHMAGFTPAALKKTVHSTCDGADRSSSSRTRKLRESPPWYGVLFSTGNDSVTGQCPQAEIAARVVEIPAPVVADSATSKRVKEIARRNYGHFPAVPVPVDDMRAAVSHAERLIGLPADGGPGETIVENLALGVAGAGYLGGKAMADAALLAATEILNQQISELEEEGVQPGEKLLEAIRQTVISQPGAYPTRDEYKTRSTAAEQRNYPPLQGFYEAPMVMVLTTKLRVIADAAGLGDPRVALRELKTAKVLVTGTEDKRLRRRLERMPGLEVPRPDVYELNLDAYTEAKMTGTTGTTGTTEGVSPVQMEFEPWSRWETGPGTGTGTGTTGEAVTSEDEGGPGGPGGERVVTPMDRRRAARVADEAENLGYFAKAVQGKNPSEGKYPNATEGQLIAGMRTFTAAMGGLNFAGPPSRVGQLLFERCEAQYGSVPVLGEPPELPAFEVPPVTMFNMIQRDRASDIETHPVVVAYDVNAQFLAVAQSVTLGTGSPDHLPGTVFLKGEHKELKKPGYVRLAAEVGMGPGNRVPAGSWVANATADYLVERDGTLEVTERYHWAESRRWLSAWGKQAGAGRRALVGRDDPASKMALTALKLMYSTFLGGFLRSGPTANNYNRTNTLRPDWADALQSLARMNMLRGIARAKPKPVSTFMDAAYFLLAEGQTVTGLKVDEETFQPGWWKLASVGRVADVAILKRPGGKTSESTLAEMLEAGSTGGVAAVVKALGEGRTAGKAASA